MSVHGVSQFLEQPGRSGWRQNSGAFQERVWEGPLILLPAFLSSELPPGYTDYIREDNGELVTIRATYQEASVDGVGNPATDGGLLERTWELDGNDLEKSLWEHPKVKAVTNTMSASEIAEIRKIVEAAVAGEITEQEDTGVDNPLVDLIRAFAKGVEAFSISQYVLRKRETILPTSVLRPSYANTNRIFTYNQLTASEPSLLTVNILGAAGLTDVIWHKRTPRLTPTTGGLWMIEQEYWGVQDYEPWIYDPAS